MVKAQPRLREIPLADIDRSRNYRIPLPGDAERLAAMKQSIEKSGQLQPVRVYERSEEQKDKKHKQPYILGFGNRRCKALEMLGKSSVLAIIFPPASDADIAQARAVENLHRQDITPLEEVQSVTDVLDAVKADPAFVGDVYEEAAARLSCDPSWVRDRDYLHRLTKPVQKFALLAALPGGHLRELAKVGDPQDQMRLACEMVGAPARAFPWDGKDKLEAWQQQLQDIYFAQLADGMVDRWPLSRLKEQVAKVQLSLRIIPWAFDQPVEFGSAKFRKCAGCPHNSETDHTLFGIDEDAGNPHGYCLNQSCYNGKHEAVEAAKEAVYKKIKDKPDHTPTAIIKVAPEWLKESTIVGHVKRQQERDAKPQPAQPKANNHRPREFTEHEKALQKFGESFVAWEKKAWKLVLAAINSDPSYRVAWCVLLGIPAFWDHPRMKIPLVQLYAQPQTKEPELPPLPMELNDAVISAFLCTREAWVAVLKAHEQLHPDSRGGFAAPHPKILELLAGEMKVKLPQRPEWRLAAPATAETAAP